MIIDAFLRLLTAPVLLLLDTLTTYTFTIPSGVFNGLSVLARDLGYLFPITAIVPIIGIKIGLRIFSLFWTIVLKVKSFVPTMGD